MAIGSTVGENIPDPSRSVNISDPFGPWVTCYSAHVSAPANSGSVITIPSAQITNSATGIFYRDNPGRYLDFRLGYTLSTGAVSADPVLQCFGRDNASDPWTQLFTTATSVSQETTLDIDATNDVVVGGVSYTGVNADQGRFDTLGFRQFLAGIKTALLTTADDTSAIIQRRFIGG